ncbi:hypothetical protein GQ42DRAFT_159943, partial [Ramicandelaber brevisporus]
MYQPRLFLPSFPLHTNTFISYKGFRSVSLSVNLSGYSFDSFGRSFRITHLLGFRTADQDA